MEKPDKTEHIPMDQVLVLKLNEDACMVVKPTEDEPDHIKSLKTFIWACLHRRNIDDNFNDDMVRWFEGYTEQEFEAAVAPTLPEMVYN